MTDQELFNLKMIQLNLRDDFNSLPREALIFKLVKTKAVIDCLISAEEDKQGSAA